MAPRRRGKQPPSSRPALPSKLAVSLLLAVAGAHNCRSPHQLGEGDRRLDAWVGDLHMTYGLAALALGGLLMLVWYWRAATSPARRPWSAVDAAAAATALAGAGLRQWCFATLGRHFTYTVGIRSGHELISEGPYSLLLHPSYLGTVLLAAGGLIYNGGLWGTFRRWWGLLWLAAGLAVSLGEARQRPGHAAVPLLAARCRCQGGLAAAAASATLPCLRCRLQPALPRRRPHPATALLPLPPACSAAHIK